MKTYIDSVIQDSNGQYRLWSNNVSTVFFYDSSAESWDRSSVTSSWYTERDYPTDDFFSGLSSDRWALSAGNNRSVSVAAGASFAIEGDEGTMYLSSENLWTVSGDFSLALGIDFSAYYDEYRSATSFGFNIHFSDNYAARAAITTNHGATSFTSELLYAENADPLFFGWQSVLGTFPVSTSYDYLTLSRVGSTITAFLGPQKLGTITGAGWSGPGHIRIGIESDEINTFRAKASHFTVLSGTISPPTVFDSYFRGESRPFPEKSLVVVDDSGVSILEYPSLDLWSRTQTGSGYPIDEVPVDITMLEGRLYMPTTSNLFLLDFVADKVKKYNKTSFETSTYGVATRNAYVSYENALSVGPFSSVVFSSASSVAQDANRFVALATTSGVSLLINDFVVKENLEGFAPAREVHFSNSGLFLWAGRNANNEGDLSYYSNVGALASISGSSFARSGYYGVSTSPYNLSSTDFTCLSTLEEGASIHIAVGSSSGVDILLDPPEEVAALVSLGVLNVNNPVSNGSFESPLFSTWTPVKNTSHPIAVVSQSSDWSTDSTYSLKLSPGNSGFTESFVPSSSYSGVFQRVDLTDVSLIFFDIRQASSSTNTLGQVSYQIWVDSTSVKSYDEPSKNQDFVKLGESIDVSGYTGFHDLLFLVVTVGTKVFSIAGRYVMFDNIRTFDLSKEFPVLSGDSSPILSCSLFLDGAAKKVLYSKQDGYGVVDLASNTEDYFVTASAGLGYSSLSGAGLILDVS